LGKRTIHAAILIKKTPWYLGIKEFFLKNILSGHFTKFPILLSIFKIHLTKCISTSNKFGIKKDEDRCINLALQMNTSNLGRGIFLSQ
jgi:hypothetical protein